MGKIQLMMFVVSAVGACSKYQEAPKGASLQTVASERPTVKEAPVGISSKNQVVADDASIGTNGSESQKMMELYDDNPVERSCPIRIIPNPPGSIQGVRIGARIGNYTMKDHYRSRKTQYGQDDECIIHSDGHYVFARYKDGDANDGMVISGEIMAVRLPINCLSIDGEILSQERLSAWINNNGCYDREHVEDMDALEGIDWVGGCPRMSGKVYCDNNDFENAVKNRLQGMGRYISGRCPSVTCRSGTVSIPREYRTGCTSVVTIGDHRLASFGGRLPGPFSPKVK